MCGVFGAGSSFRVGWRAAVGLGGGGSAFRGVCASIGKIFILCFWGWALGYSSVWFWHLPNIPNFLRCS